MDGDHSRLKTKWFIRGYPEILKPIYSYKDHIHFVKEKIKVLKTFSEEEKRRFNDEAVKIISDVYGNHTGLLVDIEKPPPIAVNLTRSAQNVTVSETRDIPSSSTYRPPLLSTMLQRTPAARVDKKKSATDNVLVAKKPYNSQTKYKEHDFKKQSRRSHTTTSSLGPRTRVQPDKTNAMNAPSNQEPPPLPRWYTLPSIPTNLPDIVNVDSDKD